MSDIPRRQLGRTGEMVSAIGLGGYHLGMPDLSEAESIRLIRSAVDRGVTFLDNCWDYHEGESEIRMGKALLDGYRERVFLMTKIDGRDRRSAAEQIDQCLSRLQTETIDLMQLHEVIRDSDPDRAFEKGGAIEAMVEAQRAGKLRYLGFTGHKSPKIHLKMLDVAAAHGFRFDTVQLPLNVMDAHFDSFGENVLPRLVEEGIGVLGMKPMGDGSIVEKQKASALECLHFALSLPTSVVITGCDSMERLEQALEAGRTFRPMSEPERASLLARTAAAARDGRLEKYKTTRDHDGTSEHPQWLGAARAV